MNHYLNIVLFKTWADLKVEATRAYIGFLWWFIEPMLYMAAFYLLFGMGLRMGGEGYVYFLLCGLVPWKWFSSTVSNGSRIIEASAGMVHQVYLPKIVLPTVTVLTNTVKFCLILPILMLFLVWAGSLNVHIAGLASVVCLFMLLTWSVACLCAAIVPFVPDLRYLIENGLLLLMFLSGVFFDLDQMSSSVSDVLYLNPVAVLIRGMRDSLLHGAWPSDLAYVLVVSLALMVVAVYLINRLDRRFAKVL